MRCKQRRGSEYGFGEIVLSWKDSSDMYPIQNVADEFKMVSAGVILNAANEAKNGGVPYTLITLQTLGIQSSMSRGFGSINTALFSVRS